MFRAEAMGPRRSPVLELGSRGFQRFHLHLPVLPVDAIGRRSSPSRQNALSQCQGSGSCLHRGHEPAPGWAGGGVDPATRGGRPTLFPSREPPPRDMQRAGATSRGWKGVVVGEAIQIVLGALVLACFWWGLFALIRLFEPRRLPRPAVRHGGTPITTYRPPEATAQLQMQGSAARIVPCCPECTAGCQVTGLAMGQAGGHGDGWWGQPFGDDGVNTEAMVFWGDECCPACRQCPICQGQGGA